LTNGPAFTLKTAVGDVAPPGAGLRTVTPADWGEVMSLAKIVARSSLPLMNVVDRLEPFQRTTDVERKFLPNTLRRKSGPPAVAEGGSKLVITGVGKLVESPGSLS
jgi:hypothetical protein